MGERMDLHAVKSVTSDTIQSQVSFFARPKPLIVITASEPSAGPKISPISDKQLSILSGSRLSSHHISSMPDLENNDVLFLCEGSK